MADKMGGGENRDLNRPGGLHLERSVLPSVGIVSLR